MAWRGVIEEYRQWLPVDAGTPVVVHAGSGPVPNEHTGPAPVLEVLRRHPRLTAVLAHMGAPEYVEFLEMAEEFEEPIGA